MNLRVAIVGKAVGLWPVAAVKASLKRAYESTGADAKPSDLHMPRVKSR